jgi:hypothetical protein
MILPPQVFPALDDTTQIGLFIGATTLSIMTFSITRPSVMAPSVTVKNATVSIMALDTVLQSVVYAERHRC